MECICNEVFTASEIQNGMKNTEKKDQWLGRVFGILALYRSTRFLPNKALASDIEITKKCASELVRLHHLKSWLCTICVHALLTMLQLSHESLVPVILECCTPLFEEVSHNEDEELVAPVPLSPSSLFFLLQTQLLLHQRGIKLASPALHRLFAANAEVSPARLATLMPIYAASTTVYPKVHPLWTASITYIQAFSDSPDVTLVEWWNAVTTVVLPTSVERKA